MIETIKKNFLQGFKTFKFWAQVLSERIKVEINVLRLIGELSKLTEKKNEILKEIGKEVYENPGELTRSEKISNLIKQIKELETVLEEKRKRLNDLEDISKWNL
uniref:Uncharacterized protein n=1 Tax=Thermodesulfovibrio aggregans TaxID=86166 RepID=A0A7C4EN72_9BACT